MSVAAMLYSTVQSIASGYTVQVAKEPTVTKAVTLYDTGGRDPIQPLGFDCAPLRRPSVQVRIKDSSYPNAYATAQAIGAALVAYTDSNIKNILQTSDIFSLGQDQNNLWIVTINFNLTLK